MNDKVFGELTYDGGWTKKENLMLWGKENVVKIVVSAYEKPIADYDAEIARKKFDNVPIEKIVSLTKAAQTVSAQQANKK